MTSASTAAAAPKIRVVSPELVVAIISPVGTPGDEFRTHLINGLNSYGYSPHWIKLSQILEAFAKDAKRAIEISVESERIAGLMTEGDRLCDTAGSAAAVAIHGVNEMRSRRVTIEIEHSSKPDGPRIAWIVDSLKRPAEVTQLRQIYGDHLVVVSLQASDDLRRTTLAQKIRPQSASKKPNEIDDIIQGLMDRDLDEQENGGQNIVKTFPMADVFVDVAGDVQFQVRRVLDLLFGNPDYPVPSSAEFGMQLASTTSTRSPELGLKVGAAIMKGGSVVSLGFNAHPHDDGATPAYDPTVADISQLLFDTLSRLDVTVLSGDAIQALKESPDAFVSELLAGPLKDGRIRHLTEFQQPVHAEMTAILDAVRRGTSLEGCALYVTTYPCHGCAKHILRLGLPVTYIEPYPKGRAESMYGDAVSASFRPFTGIAPRSYQRFFSVSGDRKLPDGARKSWTELEKLKARPNADPLIDQSGIATREEFALSQLKVGAE